MADQPTIPYRWLTKKFIPAFLRGLKKDRIKYKLDVFDCVHYARRFQIELIKELPQFGFTSKHKRPVLTVLVQQVFRALGIPARPYPHQVGHWHKLVKVITDEGPFMVEPQTGRHVELAKYKNLEYIHKEYL